MPSSCEKQRFWVGSSRSWSSHNQASLLSNSELIDGHRLVCIHRRQGQPASPEKTEQDQQKSAKGMCASADSPRQNMHLTEPGLRKEGSATRTTRQRIRPAGHRPSINNPKSRALRHPSLHPSSQTIAHAHIGVTASCSCTSVSILAVPLHETNSQHHAELPSAHQIALVILLMAVVACSSLAVPSVQGLYRKIGLSKTRGPNMDPE